MRGGVDRRTFLLATLGAGGTALFGCERSRSSSSFPSVPTTSFVDPADKTEVDRTWTRIEQWMRRRAPDALQVLRPAASDTEIRSVEAALGLQFPEPFRQSLARHDGQDEDWPSLIEFGTLLPLGDMEVVSRENEMAGLTGSEEDWWRPGWLPFVSRDGDYLSIALGTTGAGLGEVWSFLHDDEPRHALVASDFGTWLARWAAELEAGVFELDFSPGAGLLPRDGAETGLWPV